MPSAVILALGRAGAPRKLGVKGEAGLGVVHGFAAGFPMNKLKIDAVVVRMAARAVFAGAVRRYPNGVHAAPLRHAFAYLRVTFKTFQLRRAAAELVALCAVRGTG